MATPIGNLGDLSPRAVAALAGADRVLAEDTRRARALLTHAGVAGKPVDRFDASVERREVVRAVERLLGGATLALVSDAGTPTVSDPGGGLVRAAATAGVQVIAIPGPSAVLAALAASGLASGGFRFLGFLPRAGGARRDALACIANTPETVVFFESARRLRATLGELSEQMGAREAVVARELTKVHEELLRGTVAGLQAVPWLEKGEVTVVLGPWEREPAAVSEEELDERLDGLLATGMRPKDAARTLAAQSGVPARELYARAVARRDRAPGAQR